MGVWLCCPWPRWSLTRPGRVNSAASGWRQRTSSRPSVRLWRSGENYLFDYLWDFLSGLDHQQLPQGRSEGGPGGGDDSRAVQAAGAHPLAHDGDTAETPQYLQRRGIQSDMKIMSCLIISYLLQVKCSSTVKLRKIQLCSAVLHFMDKIDPGNESQSKLKVGIFNEYTWK